MYNTMMLRQFSATGFMLALSLLPFSAQAYVTPEQGLNEKTLNTRIYEPPPTDRELRDVVAEQNRKSAKQRAAGLKAVMPQPEPAPIEEMHGAAPAENISELDKILELIKLLQGNATSNTSASNATATQGNGLDPVSQRLLIRAEAQSAAAERAALIQSLIGGDGQALHSGAPLADTGPATALILIAVTGAVAETWRRVRKTSIKH